MTEYKITEKRHKKYDELENLAAECSKDIIEKIAKVLYNNDNENYFTVDVQAFVGHFLTYFNSYLIYPLTEDDKNICTDYFLSTLKEATEKVLKVFKTMED